MKKLREERTLKREETSAQRQQLREDKTKVIRPLIPDCLIGVFPFSYFVFCPRPQPSDSPTPPCTDTFFIALFPDLLSAGCCTSF
ncbi:hypothetical protein ES288_D02G077100v1 [Gossypium darwinii]|uniref:Uncharacterized protein n=1 Tax=Gossypium darwinii TaxID=34276 RepID=A0A5D2DB82_GOSDA|nr:hypothetical protein ES288_D02G077100v1 [Gossypium darwinii]